MSKKEVIQATVYIINDNDNLLRALYTYKNRARP